MTLLVAMGALALVDAVQAQTRAYLITAGTSGEDVREVTRRPSPDPLCAAPLRGLDLAQVALGMAGCAPAPRGLRPLTHRVEALILIDDRAGLSPQIARRTPPRLIQGQHIVPGTVYGMTEDRRHSQRTLVVGAAAFDSAGSDAAWVERIRSLAESFDRGNAGATRPEVRELNMPFHASAPDFQREIEAQLCVLIVCRSDEGSRMRELLGRHGDVERMRQMFAGTAEGASVRARLMIYRQDDREGRVIDLRLEPAGERVEGQDEPVRGEGPGPALILGRSIDAGLRAVQGRTEYWASTMRCALLMLRADPSARDRYFTPQHVLEANQTNRVPTAYRLREMLARLDPEQADVMTGVNGERREVRRTEAGLRAALEAYANDITQGINQAERFVATQEARTAVAIQQMVADMARGQGDPHDIYSCWASRR